MTFKVALPKKLIPVFAGEADVRGAYGGRGSGKTMGFAKMTAVRAYMWASSGKTGIILCARQFMNSLDDSSMEEVKAAIESEEWLKDYFDIGEKYIRTKCGRIAYKFSGLDRNIASVKSKAKILLCWVDEAEPVTELAWKTLIPTLRDEESELWVTWNPQRKGSATDIRFRRTQDPRIKVVQINWRDNKKFPAILERARLRDLRERPDDYEHIWEGAYGLAHGAILGKWVTVAERDGRVNDTVEYDPDGAQLEISCDLGYRDTASFWFFQRVLGGVHVLGYDGDSGLDADEWIPRIFAYASELGCKGTPKVWLPHDARAKTFQSQHTTIEKFAKVFGAGNVAIVPMASKSDRIEAARTVIGKCAFHVDRCEDGLDGLRSWEYTYNEDTATFSREPLHNWASHPSDAFSYGCQVLRDMEVPPEKVDPKFTVSGKENQILIDTNTLSWESSSRYQRI